MQPSGIIKLVTNNILVIVNHSLIFKVTIPDAASVRFNLLMMSI